MAEEEEDWELVLDVLATEIEMLPSFDFDSTLDGLSFLRLLLSSLPGLLLSRLAKIGGDEAFVAVLNR